MYHSLPKDYRDAVHIVHPEQDLRDRIYVASEL